MTATAFDLRRLGDVCDVRRGTMITEKQTTPGAVPVVAGGIEPTYFHSVSNRAPGAITISASGANAGYVAYWDVPIWASDATSVEAHDDVVGRFIFHQLKWMESRIQTTLRRGAAQPHVYAKDVAELDVAIPPMEEQRRIAVVLDAADELRAKRRRAFAKLDTLSRSIFIDMFGDPVGNPMGWESLIVGDALTFMKYGPRFYNEPYSDVGIPVVRITDLDSSGGLDFSAMPRYGVSPQHRKKHRLAPGDIIFARSGATVGKVALVKPGDPECIAGAYFVHMRFRDEVEPEYARAVLTSNSVQSIVRIKSRQAAQQNFSGPGIRQLPFPLPPTSLQRKFAVAAGRIDGMRARLGADLDMLDALFASLQHRAFRGEL